MVSYTQNTEFSSIHFQKQKICLWTAFTLIGIFWVTACQKTPEEGDPLFEKMQSSETGIKFDNRLTFSEDFNIYTYRNFYNGGGVGIGDVNNDSLPDIYFVGNQVPNRLYLNKGNFEFADVTEQAGVAGNKAWATGVSIIDINGDGWLDIYVCNSGDVKGDDKKNELFINNKDGTFTEKAEDYGIADLGFSIHGAFFDYDKDGDLDLYLLNNSYRAIGSFDLQVNKRNERDAIGGDKLYRNDGNTFTDVSEEAGIYGSVIGFGLGVSVADFNRDSWPDMYISNDFFERDYLYINNADGTFAEVLTEQMYSIPGASMGADVADINGDLYPDIFVTEMLPESESRRKSITTFENWKKYQFVVENGYHHQFTRNMLQLNNGNGTYSEIGRLAGVEATDWSWGALMADFDHDGHRDLFVANGIFKDLTNLDYLQEISRDEVVKSIVSGNNVDYERLIEIIPSNPVSNYMFAGDGKFKFSNRAEYWGLSQPSFSNGSAYGDLDNDGDLDLVVNNVNMEAFVYRNRAEKLRSDSHWLAVSPEGPALNDFGVGAQVTISAGGRRQYSEQMPVRGFQSTVHHQVHFGLGNAEIVDTLWISWPDGRVSRKTELSVDQKVTVSWKDAGKEYEAPTPRAIPSQQLLTRLPEDSLGIDWEHKESSYNDFLRQPLLQHMRSAEGPAACSGDTNRDGLEDIYLGGAKGQAGVIYMQNVEGTFNRSEHSVITADKISEDIDCIFFDADNDGYPDLYVGSGSSEFPGSSSALADRLYLNDVEGGFTKIDPARLPTARRYQATGAVAAGDFDGDGDIDLFVGGRLTPFAYGVPAGGILLENDGLGNFTDVTGEKAKGLQNLAMVTTAAWSDTDNDGDLDLWVSGEWMPITVFSNQTESGTPILRESTSAAGLDSTHGWWHALALEDLDGDGDLDWIGGNHGLNSQYRAGRDEPVELWTGDFDQNGSVDHLLSRYKNGETYPIALRHNLLDRLPFLEPRYPDYVSYAGEPTRDILSKEQQGQALHHRAYQLASAVGWNDGTGRFKVEVLPAKAQLSPVHGILTTDIDDDGKPEILLGGNQSRVKPQSGPYMASYGVVLKLDSYKSWNAIPAKASGLSISGEIRQILELNGAGRPNRLLFVRNNEPPLVYELKNRIIE